MSTIGNFTPYTKQTWKNAPNRTTPVSAERLIHMEDGIKANSDAVEYFIEELLGGSGQEKEVTELVVGDSDFSIDGFCRVNGSFGSNTGYARTDHVDVSAYDSITVHVRPRSDSVSPCVWFDADKNYISGETAEILTESDYTYEVPDGAVYAIFSSEKTVENPRTVHGTRYVFSPGGAFYSAQTTCYISPNGSDDNDGLTADTPVLTLERAKDLLSKDGELIFMEGDYINFSYDLSLFAKVSTVGDARLVYYAERFTEAALVDGYARVYAVPYSGSYSDYLWQFDVPDANTAISEDERHPLQRNRTHRLEHTRMYPVTKFDTTSTDLNGYLTTMEQTTDKWMYYMDGTNCYFTVSDTDFATHPVIIPSKTTLKASEKRTVSISGLKIYFASILTTNLNGVLDGLTVGYHTDKGVIRWDNTFNLTLNNCEAVAGTNDGINGHTAGDIVCHNCWGHDNADDGESDHEACHIVQYGGLYEYNGNGCTPASGASGEYINTICRNNGEWDWVSDPAGTGFSAQNTSTTEPAFMYCIGCHSYDNKIGFRQKSSSKATFINCISKNDETAFGTGTQINCTISGVTNTSTSAVAPYIGANGNWFIEETDTGIRAEGKDGVDGYSPVRGVDYWTDSDREAIIDDIIAILATPVFGAVDENNNIILSGNLASGTYTVKYEDADGKTTLIGTLDACINQIPVSTDVDGSIYNGSGYKTASRCTSSGAVSAIANTSAEKPPFVTGFIPCKQGDVIRLKNCYIHAFYGDGESAIGVTHGDGAWGLRSCLYDSDKNFLDAFSWGDLSENNATDKISHAQSGTEFYLTEFTVVYPDVSYIRLTLGTDSTPADAIVTVNQQIS